MPKTLDLEREFFKISKDHKYWEDVRRHFNRRVKELSKEFFDYKIRCGVLGLEQKNKDKNLFE